MKKICFVIQRYGLDVNGGAELQCRLFAERLKEFYTVEVLTTKAKDSLTWKNEYSADEEYINGIRVIRMENDRERNLKQFSRLNGSFMQKILGNPEKEKEWLIEQGPYCPKLVRYIQDHRDDYDVFIFSTYLYYPTVFGIRKVLDKAILIPEAHDEPYINMAVLRDVFRKPKALLYNTEVEKNMVEALFLNGKVRNATAGIGIDADLSGDAQAGKEKYGLDKYLVYIGRVEEGKQCGKLFQYFLEYKKRNRNDLRLVLIGKKGMPVPADKDIVALGFIDEKDKCDLLTGAQALVLPSEFESLSMVVLEAMKLQIPVVVNGKCAVVKSHCTKSNGGLYYLNYFEFEGILNWLFSHPEESRVMGQNGAEYVQNNYEWNVITGKIRNLIEAVTGSDD